MAKIKADFKGLRSLKRRLNGIKSLQGHVGYFEQDTYPDPAPSRDKGPYDRNGENVATIAYANNFGLMVTSSAIPIPKRPFFTLAMEDIERTFKADIAVVARSLVKGDGLFNTRFKEYLKKLQKRIKLEILMGSFTANAPITVKLKGFDKPLVRTGRMRDSVKIRIARSV